MKKTFNATHPGEVIKDELSARGICQKKFAACIGVPYTMFNDILNERRPLSPAIAIYIESALGISADILMGLQADYTMQRARNDKEVQRRLLQVHPFPLSVAVE